MGESQEQTEKIDSALSEKTWERLLKIGGAELAKDVTNPRKLIVLVTKPPLAIPPYSDLLDAGDKISAEAYFEAVATYLTSPEHIHALINPPYLSWKPTPKEKEDQDPLLEASEVIKNGGADCDNLSWLAKCFLDRLGESKRIDYKARVIGGDNHAFTIYEENGEKRYFDQWDKGAFINRSDLTRLKNLPKKDYLLEVALFNGHGVHRSVDPISLERTYQAMEVVVYQAYTESFKPEKELPPDWKDYAITFIEFNNETEIYYKSGILFQKTSPAGTIGYDLDGQIIQMDMPNGDVMSFNNGQLKEKKYGSDRHIERDLYFQGGTVVYQRFYREGEPLKAEVFRETGEIMQRNYWEDHSYEKEIFNESGKPIQRNYWDGSIDKLDPATGKVLKHFPPK